MKKILLSLLIFLITIMQACNKDSAADTKPAVADIPLLLYDMRLVGDSINTYFSDSAKFVLKSDYNWTLDVKGAKSYGTYTWQPTVAYTAQIKFTINQWTMFGTDTAIANKLKNVLLKVEECTFPYQVYFTGSNYSTTLRTNKQ